jgi:phage terminase large subunit GpA-like protein
LPDSRTTDSGRWLAQQFAALTDHLDPVKPSDWAERRRYLAPEQSALPGYYSFTVTPYLREPLDCMSPFSPVSEIDFLKGVQIGFTSGILENLIGYLVDQVKDAPAMLLTVDDGMAALRKDSHISPMLRTSGLDVLIKSHDVTNKRKSGSAGKRIEWQGGGSLIIQGARSAGKLRSTPIRFLMEDEVDAYPDKVGREGDPMALAEDRTAAFEGSRKIIRGSTPLVMQTSRIFREFMKGDQRRYMVPCKHCGKFQDLRFSGIEDDGTAYGLRWDTESDGSLRPGSVRYICHYCAGEWENDDKANFLGRGRWEPTARSEYPGRRSYHLSALYSPVGMQTWEALVRKWLEAWDVESGRPRNKEKLQQFYNNVLGWPWEEHGESPKFEIVTQHRRGIYHSAKIPNEAAREEGGGRVEVITAAVDVHEERIDILTGGWTRGQRFWGLDWVRIKGDTEDLEGKAWAGLRDLIENRVYLADDGARYRIQMTVIDAGFRSDTVYAFCGDYSAGVFPIMGRDAPIRSAQIAEFSEYKTKAGTIAFNVTSTIYKDRISAALRRERTGPRQPEGCLNFPQDFPDEFFRQLTAETRRERINAKTGQREGFVWHRTPGRANHAWDLMVYNTAALEMIAFDTCKREAGLEFIDWRWFWDYVEGSGIFRG